jgi:trans-aconitate methyltransferase
VEVSPHEPGARGVVGPGWATPLHAAVLERAGTGALLDLGCGPGEFARYATDRGARVTGVDVDRGAVAAAAALVPEATFLIGDAADPPPGPFAAAVAV